VGGVGFWGLTPKLVRLRLNSNFGEKKERDSEQNLRAQEKRQGRKNQRYGTGWFFKKGVAGPSRSESEKKSRGPIGVVGCEDGGK